jgi:hypothetical protein
LVSGFSTQTFVFGKWVAYPQERLLWHGYQKPKGKNKINGLVFCHVEMFIMSDPNPPPQPNPGDPVPQPDPNNPEPEPVGNQ